MGNVDENFLATDGYNLSGQAFIYGHIHRSETSAINFAYFGVSSVGVCYEVWNKFYQGYMN